MDAFLGPLRIARQRAAHAYLALLEALPGTMRSVPAPTGFGFRVPLGREDGDYFLSISFPMDFPFAETALFCGDSMTHRADWGYHDIRREWHGSHPIRRRSTRWWQRFGVWAGSPGIPEVPEDENENYQN